MSSQNSELIKLNKEQLTDIYKETTQKIIEYLTENESKMTSENKETYSIENKFEEEATKLIKSKILNIVKNFDEKSQEHQQKHVQYNLIEVEKVLKDHLK